MINNSKVSYQVTLISNKGYKPVSTVVMYEQADAGADLTSDKEIKKIIQNKGIVAMCNKRRWNTRDLKVYGYTKVKCRVYEKAKREAENKARYEKIKEEKYATGEWKRPKKAETK